MTRGRDEGVSARSQRSAWERSQDAPRSELETGMFVKRLIDLPLAEIESLLVESRAEGYNFVDRLADDYADDSNRFDKPGEALFGVYADGRLIAVGGLNRDPYLPDANAGRVRHVYVLAAYKTFRVIDCPQF